MSNFAFKETRLTSMKAAGIMDTDTMTICIDGEDKKLSTLLSAFNGSEINILVKVKEENELDEPVESDKE